MLISTAYVIFLTPLTLAASLSLCYFPDGTYMSFDSPCFPDQAESFCCGQGHSCMSNGLCRWPDEDMPAPLAYIRGSCTDPTWESSACPQHCANVLPDEWDAIIACPNNEYCCSADNSEDQACCTANDTTPASVPSASLTIFDLGPATTVTVIGAAGYTAVGTSSYVFASATATSQTNTTPAAGSKGTSSGTTIGIGAGVGGGVALLILLGAWLLWRRRNSKKSQKQKDNAASQAHMTPPGPPYYENTTGYATEKDRIVEERKDVTSKLPHEQIHVLDGTPLNGPHLVTNGIAELDGRWSHAELPG